MTTALTHQSFMGRLRTLALAGTLALGALVPVAPGALASGDTETPVVTVDATAGQFDIDPAGGLEGLQAQVDGGGEGVNLRVEAAHDAEVIETVPDGTIVDLRVDMLDTVYDDDGLTRWWPVSVGGVDGWIAGFYLVEVEAAPAATVLTNDKAGSQPAATTRMPYEYTGDFVPPMFAQISADGDGLVLRAEPSGTSDELASIPEGTVVELRIDILDTVYDEQGTRWWPVEVDGVQGWVSGFYLIDPDTEAADPTVPATEAVFGVGDTVRVVTPSGTGLVVRADPGPDGARLTSLTELQEVQVLEGPVSFEGSAVGWYLITTGDVSGYVDGDLLELVKKATVDAPAATDAAFEVGDWAEIRTATGEGIALRAGPSANTDESGFAPHQGLVEILAGPEGGWYEVRWDRQIGYIDGALLVPAEAPTLIDDEAVTTTATARTAADSGEPAALTNGDYAQIDAGSDVGVNVREEPSVDAERAGFLDEGVVVQVTDGPEPDDDGVPWYRITDGSLSGWVRGDLLVQTEAPATARQPQSEREAAQAPAEDDSAEQDAVAGFILPVQNFRFTQDFGCSSLGFYAYDATFGCSVHDGVDLAAPSGTPIYAVGAGEVVAAGWCNCGLGYYVEIDHGNGLHTVYGHMASQPTVSVGQRVAQGDVIGPVGSTGLSTGPHVHFMVRQDGATQDPKNYLPPLT